MSFDNRGQKEDINILSGFAAMKVLLEMIPETQEDYDKMIVFFEDPSPSDMKPLRAIGRMGIQALGAAMIAALKGENLTVIEIDKSNAVYR